MIIDILVYQKFYIFNFFVALPNQTHLEKKNTFFSRDSLQLQFIFDKFIWF